MALCVMLEGTLPHHEPGDGRFGTSEFRGHFQENLERWEKDIFGFLGSHTSQFGSGKAPTLFHSRRTRVLPTLSYGLKLVPGHSTQGIRGPVRTGTETACKLFAALRLQRRLDGPPGHGGRPVVFHHYGTTAPPKSGASPPPGLESLSSTPQVVPTPGLDCRPGLFQALPSSWTTWSTLPRRVRLLGLSGGRWAATDGKAETAVTKRFLFFFEVLIVTCTVHGSHGARFYIIFKSVVTSSGKECGKHSGSASAR